MDPLNRTGNALQGSHPGRPQNPPILAAAGHPGGGPQTYSYGMAGGYYTPANPPVPNQNRTPMYYHSPYGANTMGFGQTIPNQSLNHQMQYGLGMVPTAASTTSQAVPNQGSNSRLPQCGGPTGTPLGKNNVARQSFPPTPTQTMANKRLSSHSTRPTMKASEGSSRLIIGESLRLDSDKKKSRNKNRNRRKALLPTPTQQINVPSSSQFVGTCPIIDGRQLAQVVIAPDGTTNKKYPAPVVNNLLFDSSTGYRFDPTTGLHYDANSGFYLNNRLKLLLRWDPISSTYVLVSNNTSGLAKPVVNLMNQSHGRTSGPLEPNMHLNRGRYEPSPDRNDRYDVPLHRERSLRPEPDPYLSHESSLEYSDDEREPYFYETSHYRDGSPDFYPSDEERYRQSSPERLPVGDLREYLRRDQPQGYYPSSSDRYDVRDRVWDDDRRGIRSSPRRRRSRSSLRRSSRSPPRRRRRTPSRRRRRTPSRRRSRTPPRKRSRNHSGDREIMKIHEKEHVKSRLGQRDDKKPRRSNENAQSVTLEKKYEAARERRGGDPNDRRIYSALPSSKRRRSPHSVKKPLAAESCFQALGEEFVVIDECKEESDDDGNKSVPFLRHPINQVIKEQLKNVISLHKKNSEDPDNVLRDLFNDDLSLKAFVLLAPVPPDREALVRMELETILTSDGDDFVDFGIFQGKGLGAPCHYGLVQFCKPAKALNWYNEHEALLHLNCADEQFKAFMFFSNNNWTCLHCRFTNFPLRNWCNRCFKNKNKNVFSPVSESHTPTKFLGVSSSGLPHNMTESSFTTENIVANLPEETKQLVTKFMLEDKGLPGLCVIEAEDPKECENLRKHLLSKGWRTSFLQMHKEPSDDSGITESDNTPKTDRSVVALPEQKNRPVVNNVERKYDSLKHIFDNSKTSQCIFMSPTPNIRARVVREHLENLLERDGLNFSCSFEFCRPQVYGAPQDYIQIRFSDLEVAESWFQKHNGVVEFVFPETPVRNELKFQMNMHYSPGAWPCRACSILNFPARSLCHKCYANKDEDGFTPVTISSTPTKWVGISCLGETIYNVDQVKKSLPPLDGFQIVRMLFIKEFNPLLHVGLCVIETPSEEDGRGLAEYIQTHPALKYNNEKKAKIIFVNLNERLGEEGSEQSSRADALGVLCSSSDGPFSPNDSADNFNHWWKHFQNGVAEGEDVLKNLFQDQYVVPLPSGDSVLVPLPPSQLVFSQDNTTHFNRALYVPLLEKAGVGIEMAEKVKLYHGKIVGSPCAYTILKFETASEATAWRAIHNDKWIIQLKNGSPWTSFLHPCDPNWKCEKCNNHNFPLRLHCFCCYTHRFGGAPIVTVSDTPTKFVGITKFQNWCASEEILFENIKILSKMKENQQLKEVHFLTEPSGISLGLCILELENAETSRFIFTYLIGLTQRRQNIVYMEINSRDA